MTALRPAKLFPTDDPLQANEMIGRSADIEQLSVRMQAYTNLVVAAPRRTGKTTTCGAALDRAGEQGCGIVKLDLYRISSVEQLASSLVEAVFLTRPPLRRGVHEAKQGGRSIYEFLQLGLSVKLLGTPGLEGIDLNLLPQLKTASPEIQVDYALTLPERIATADNRHLIVYIDEFQDINRIGQSYGSKWDAVLKRKMRAAFQESEHVSFLFAGSYEDMMQVLFGDRREPFFNFGSMHNLSPIIADDWIAGLREKYITGGMQIADEVLQSLVTRGEGHPRSTMLIAQHAYTTALLNGGKRISVDILEYAYGQALAAEKAKHEAWVDRIRAVSSQAVNRLTFRVAQAVALGKPPYALSKQAKEVQRALDALRGAGFVYDQGGSWRLTDPLFAEYLRALPH